LEISLQALDPLSGLKQLESDLSRRGSSIPLNLIRVGRGPQHFKFPPHGSQNKGDRTKDELGAGASSAGQRKETKTPIRQRGKKVPCLWAKPFICSHCQQVPIKCLTGDNMTSLLQNVLNPGAFGANVVVTNNQSKGRLGREVWKIRSF
jgi:hypothetical protein